jgi:hypothetical protein
MSDEYYCHKCNRHYPKEGICLCGDENCANVVSKKPFEITANEVIINNVDERLIDITQMPVVTADINETEMREAIFKSVSIRAQNWIDFSMKVLQHIENYCIPQYGDAGQDQVTNWTTDDCLKAVKKRLDRFGRNSRINQQELDFLKIAHEVQLAAEKYAEMPTSEANKLSFDEAEKALRILFKQCRLSASDQESGFLNTVSNKLGL